MREGHTEIAVVDASSNGLGSANRSGLLVVKPIVFNEFAVAPSWALPDNSKLLKGSILPCGRQER
jgi:hypothetical protein